MNTIVYRIGDKLYINLTNRCSNACDFCVRVNDSYSEYSLWLDSEPTAEQVKDELSKSLTPDIKEAVFCGYGEPLYRLDVIIEVAKFLKTQGLRVRLNTNGQADFICGEGAADRLAGLVDTVSISLNAATAAEYQAVCHSEFGEEAYASLLKFAKELQGKTRVVLSVVDCIGEQNIRKAAEVAASVGAEFRVRAMI